jgi:hypothetical protein
MRTAVFAATSLIVAAPLAAQNASGAFVIRLGRDTSAVESFARRGNRIEGEIVQRFPRTSLRRYVIDLRDDGSLERAEVSGLRPDNPAATPVSVTTITWAGTDSLNVELRRDTSVTRRRFAVQAGATVLAGAAATSWMGFEMLAQRFRRLRADSASLRYYVLGGNATHAVLKRIGRDSISIYDGNNTFHARWDGEGRIQRAEPVGGTQQFTVERVPPRQADVRALAAAFAARDAQGQGLGALSTRDTVRAAVAGANIWIDYGRPSKRGRVLFGSTIVPWGQVWRTGANAATQFRTDRDLEIQGIAIPAGTYTLWTIPYQNGAWKLLVNRQTGQWGTVHDPARDMAQLDLAVSALPGVVERFTIGVAPGSNGGGTLTLDWDTVRASLTFTVR